MIKTVSKNFIRLEKVTKICILNLHHTKNECGPYDFRANIDYTDETAARMKIVKSCHNLYNFLSTLNRSGLDTKYQTTIG